ncbi:MAG: hypothetical protein ACRDRH_14000 [Pseudonocardia sp.]
MISNLQPPTLTMASWTTTTGSPPYAQQAPAAAGGVLLAAVLSGAVIAAVISGFINTVLASRASRMEERARVRASLAEAFQAYSDYKEFPYAIRRRRADQPADERVRLSEELRRVRSRLSYHQAWTLAEDPTTGAAYTELVHRLRALAGASMHDAWNGPPLDDDPGMNIGPDEVDLGGLRDAEQEFLDAAKRHVNALAGTWFPRRRRVQNT